MHSQYKLSTGAIERMLRNTEMGRPIVRVDDIGTTEDSLYTLELSDGEDSTSDVIVHSHCSTASELTVGCHIRVDDYNAAPFGENKIVHIFISSLSLVTLSNDTQAPDMVDIATPEPKTHSQRLGLSQKHYAQRMSPPSHEDTTTATVSTTPANTDAIKDGSVDSDKIVSNVERTGQQQPNARSVDSVVHSQRLRSSQRRLIANTSTMSPQQLPSDSVHSQRLRYSKRLLAVHSLPTVVDAKIIADGQEVSDPKKKRTGNRKCTHIILNPIHKLFVKAIEEGTCDAGYCMISTTRAIGFDLEFGLWEEAFTMLKANIKQGYYVSPRFWGSYFGFVGKHHKGKKGNKSKIMIPTSKLQPNSDELLRELSLQTNSMEPTVNGEKYCIFLLMSQVDGIGTTVENIKTHSAAFVVRQLSNLTVQYYYYETMAEEDPPWRPMAFISKIDNIRHTNVINVIYGSQTTTHDCFHRVLNWIDSVIKEEIDFNKSSRKYYLNTAYGFKP